MSSSAKAELRRTVGAQRANLSDDERRAADAAICERLRPLVLLPALPRLRVAAYAALPSEVHLAPLLRDVCARYAAVALPVFGPGGTPALAACTNVDALIPGARGVQVPPEPWTLVDAGAVDVIVVPGVAFDRTGARLGRGAGFYDRLLARAPGRRIGVAYECQLVDTIPAEPHDARVDVVATEERLYVTRDWRFDTL